MVNTSALNKLEIMEKIKNTVIKKDKVVTSKKDESKKCKFVSTICHSLFNGEKISAHDFSKVFDIAHGSNVELEENILKRGMDILRKEVKERLGNPYLVKLSDIWKNLYQNILPTLQLWFSKTHEMTIKEMVMTSFRDNVILKLKVEEALHANESSLPIAIKQMFLVTLQVVKNYSEKYFKLEALIARVVSPFLGTKGLYVRSEVKEYNEKSKHLLPAFASNFNSAESSPEVTERDVHSDLEFEELLSHRRQVFHRDDTRQRLPCVEEKGISDSLASLLADGFEMG